MSVCAHIYMYDEIFIHIHPRSIYIYPLQSRSFWTPPVSPVVFICTWSGSYTYTHILLSLQALFAITHYSYQWLVHLNTVSPIMMYKNRNTYFTKDYWFAKYYFTYIIYMCIYTHIYEYTYMYSINSSVYYDVRESIRIHMYMTIVSLIYTYIYVYTYMYIHIYIHTYIYLYLMDTSSIPKIAMSSGDLPAISCTKS